jgi:hypothetical protein
MFFNSIGHSRNCSSFALDDLSQMGSVLIIGLRARKQLGSVDTESARTGDALAFVSPVEDPFP